MKNSRQILSSVNELIVFEYCFGINAIIREAHIDFHDGKNYECYVPIIFYKGVIEYLQIGSS